MHPVDKRFDLVLLVQKTCLMHKPSSKKRRLVMFSRERMAMVFVILLLTSLMPLSILADDGDAVNNRCRKAPYASLQTIGGCTGMVNCTAGACDTRTVFETAIPGACDNENNKDCRTPNPTPFTGVRCDEWKT